MHENVRSATGSFSFPEFGRPRRGRDVPPRRQLRTVRCACRRCGAHVMARGGYVLSGECGNCHGYDLIPVD